MDFEDCRRDREDKLVLNFSHEVDEVFLHTVNDHIFHENCLLVCAAFEVTLDVESFQLMQQTSEEFEANIQVFILIFDHFIGIDAGILQ